MEGTHEHDLVDRAVGRQVADAGGPRRLVVWGQIAQLVRECVRTRLATLCGRAGGMKTKVRAQNSEREQAQGEHGVSLRFRVGSGGGWERRRWRTLALERARISMAAKDSASCGPRCVPVCEHAVAGVASGRNGRRVELQPGPITGAVQRTRRRQKRPPGGRAADMEVCREGSIDSVQATGTCTSGA